MTTFTTDRADSGEIPRPVGETRRSIDVGEATQNLGEYLQTSPSFDAIPRKVIDLDDTVIFRGSRVIGLGDLDDKPHPKPPPLPKPPKDMADAQPVAPWERVAATERLSLLGSVAGLDGDLRPAVPPKPAPPKPKPAPRSSYVGRHRAPSTSMWATVFARLWGAL
jgi:hypothetical protein